MRTLLAAIVIAACAAAPAGAQAGVGKAAAPRFDDRPFLELLGHLEGPDGYEDLTRLATLPLPKPVTAMTVDEVLDFQRALRQRGARSTAMGRYQFIYKTLLHMTVYYRIDRSQRFGPRLQDHLTRLELYRCGFYDAAVEVHELGDCLASVWAALPLLTGPNRGQSRYKATGINTALTSPEIMEALLRHRFAAPPAPAPAGAPGFTVKAAAYVPPPAPGVRPEEIFDAATLGRLDEARRILLEARENG